MIKFSKNNLKADCPFWFLCSNSVGENILFLFLNIFRLTASLTIDIFKDNCIQNRWNNTHFDWPGVNENKKLFEKFLFKHFRKNFKNILFFFITFSINGKTCKYLLIQMMKLTIFSLIKIRCPASYTGRRCQEINYLPGKCLLFRLFYSFLLSYQETKYFSYI